MDEGRDSPRLRLLMAEDQYLTREGTRRLLEERDELEVVGVASDLDSVLAEARRLRPDVVLMDIKMPPSYSSPAVRSPELVRSTSPPSAQGGLPPQAGRGHRRSSPTPGRPRRSRDDALCARQASLNAPAGSAPRQAGLASAVLEENPIELGGPPACDSAATQRA